MDWTFIGFNMMDTMFYMRSTKLDLEDHSVYEFMIISRIRTSICMMTKMRV
jgi:hypothetical protein